jgi:hypothetical protein
MDSNTFLIVTQSYSINKDIRFVQHNYIILLGFSAEIGLDISQILVTAAMTLTLDQAIKRGLILKVHALFL